MKILVTGSEGSLMQVVIPKLVAQGHKVIGVDSLMRYGDRPGHARVDYEFVCMDLTRRDEVEGLFENVKPDYVIQAAARIYGVGGFNKYCADILGEDITLHNNVLKAAVKNNVKRVVYISSSMVYENCPQQIDWPVFESMIDRYPAPHTEYGLSKFSGERLSIAFSKQYGVDYTIWRPFNIITPYEKVNNQDLGVSHVFADYIENIVVKKLNPLPIIGDGSQVRCFTWIDEVAEAIANHSFSSETQNEIYNLGNAEPITMKQLAEIIYTEAGFEGELKFETVANYKNDVMVRIPNVNKAKEFLKWEAKKKVTESIRECLNQFA
jgi:nucleoside-diphosphate-sugar epimerase